MIVIGFLIVTNQQLLLTKAAVSKVSLCYICVNLRNKFVWKCTWS